MTSIAGPSSVRERQQPPHPDKSLEGLCSQDLNELEQVIKVARQDDRLLTDRELAIEFMISEARRLASLREDRHLALRLAQGIPDVQSMDASHRGSTEQRMVHIVDTEVDGLPRDERPRPVVQRSQTQGHRGVSSIVKSVLPRFPKSYVPAPQARRAQTSPAPTARAKASPGPSGHDCVICMDPIIGVDVATPCGHHYDKRCILELFESAAKDESLFPPRCCRKNIPLNSVQVHMSADLLYRFKEKSEEFRTPKRVYCANPTCSRFLGPQQEPSVWSFKSSPTSKSCSAAGCTTTTCLRCKNKVTGAGHRCVENTQDMPVLSLGREAGWTRCPGCETLVELNIGCFHMTCRCKTEFCYLCGKCWKTCTCPQWDERSLLAAAEARVDARLARRPAAQIRGDRGNVVAAVLDEPVLDEVERTPGEIQRVARGMDVDPLQREVHQCMMARLRPLPSSPATGMQVEQTCNSASSSAQAQPVPMPSKNRKSAKDRSKTREELIRKWMHRLRVDHDCAHTEWQYTRGAHHCERCQNCMNLDLFLCTGCETVACRRCRMNRI